MNGERAAPQVARWGRVDDSAQRERRILQFAPLVKYVIGRMSVSLPGVLSTEDLLSYGTIGLIQAVDRFDPEVGVKFETYAIQRIRGSILDAVRSLQPLSRDAMRRAREIEQAYDTITQRVGRMAQDWEVADELGVSMEQFHKIVVESSAFVVSLDAPLADDGNDGAQDTALVDAIVDESIIPAVDRIERQDLHRALVSALETLSERERLVINLYYCEELTLKEIGEVLDVSTSRVSQIHAATLFKLRSALRAREPAMAVT